MVRRRASVLVVSLVVGLFCAGAFPLGAPPTIDPALYGGMTWRNIGPFRGGRVSAVSGAVGQSGVFYIGLPLGGVWKTTSAGETWFPVFDSVKEASSVGAVAVAPSNPNVIYAGMGDLITGGGINEGNGVYKSTDAGKSWHHLGLDETRQIPRIFVDPHDPDLVMVAAQGNVHTHSEERGLYRSTDGGKTWKKTLYVDNQTGIQDIEAAFDHPAVMFAMTVRHYTDPLAQRGAPAAAPPAPNPNPANPPAPGTPGSPDAAGRGRGRGTGPEGPTGTAIYKSTDEGATWTELKGDGLPALVGRTSIAIAQNTNSQRVFLIGTFGLYRSDDGGGHWQQMAADDKRIANGQGNYTSGVYVDSKNPDIVYTLATSSYRSLDGGKTFTGFKGAPGGDDPQQLWIDPVDGTRMLLGGDQGACVSLDAGGTWSSWYNQATAQVYHISTDTQWPYWVYATQQDSGSIATRSRGDLGEITNLDWYPTAGYEFGSIVADPLNPKIVYAGGPAAGIVKITYPSGQWINVSPNVVTSDQLRKVGNQPLIFSPSNPHELLAGFQYLMSTVDGGMHWSKLSPDLGYAKGVVPPKSEPTPPGPARPGSTPPGSIESISPSGVASGVIWVGTNNGLIKLTKDHGKSWDDVTIPNLPNPTRADVSAIDASHHEAGTAYVAIDFHAVGDYRPYLYRTRDYGASWTKIVEGLAVDQPGGSFTRVIRNDTKKAGLLFAGTESSMYVSFNDGDTWQSLQLNLPNTSFRDLTIHGNDLVVGTYGRGFWILDDISPLRQMTPQVGADPAHLFAPGDAIRVRRNVNGDTPFPPEVPHAANPPVGALIYYYLASDASAVTLDVVNSAGAVVRHLSSAPIPPFHEPAAPVPGFWIEKPQPMPASSGMHRINWDIRYDPPPATAHTYEIDATPFETPPSPQGALALPGVYTLKLSVDGKVYTQALTVKNDPRSPASAADLQAQHDLQMKVTKGIVAASGGREQVTAMRAAIADLMKSQLKDVAEAARAFDVKLAAVGGTANSGRRGGGGGNAGGPPPPPNFTNLQTTMIRQLDTLEWGDMAPNDPMQREFTATCGELKTAAANWEAVNGSELATFNGLLQKNQVAAVTSTASALSLPACGASPKGAPARGNRR